jgi:hypothetical protein
VAAGRVEAVAVPRFGVDDRCCRRVLKLRDGLGAVAEWEADQ